MGEDPSVPRSFDLSIHPFIMSRIKFWTDKGLERRDSDDLLIKYKRNDALEAPKLNIPVESRLSIAAKRRDEYKRQAQNAIGSALMAIGAVTSSFLIEKDSIDAQETFEILLDSIKILSDVFYKQSLSRRVTITPAFNKSIKEILDKSKADEFLFGNDLLTKIKEAKTIERLTADIRQPSTSATLYTKNWNRRSDFRPGISQTGQSLRGRPRLSFRYNQKPQSTQRSRIWQNNPRQNIPPQNKIPLTKKNQ